MGNKILEESQQGTTIPYNCSQLSDQFIIKPILTQSPEHHQQLISLIARFKQFQCPHLIKLVDSHSVQSYNLCSIISHIYLVVQKPTFTLKTYAEHLKEKELHFDSKQLSSILLGCCKAIEYLCKSGVEVDRITESQVCIDFDQKGEIISKIMNPYFVDEEVDWGEDKNIEAQLGQIFASYINQEAVELKQLIELMTQGAIALKQVQSRLKENRKNKLGLKLTRNINQYKQARQSMNSVVSNTSSLMIDGGDVSDLMFKHFYENFDEVSQISGTESRINSTTAYDLQTSHKFPKKYLKGKAFRKMNQTIHTHQTTESGQISNLWKSNQRNNLTRDSSAKQNVYVQSKLFVLQSAKLVQSYVGTFPR